MKHLADPDRETLHQLLLKIQPEAKQKWIYTDARIPPNLNQGSLPATYDTPNLQTAIEYLMLELKIFDGHFKPAGAAVNHGAYGPINYNEWMIWHDKHLAHI